MAQMIAASSYGGNVYMSNEDYRKRKEANMKRIAKVNNKRFGERALSKFVIHGHEIEVIHVRTRLL